MNNNYELYELWHIGCEEVYNEDVMDEDDLIDFKEG